MTDSERADLSSIVFVVGMHRSGTSALTRVLNLAGLRLPEEMMGANQDNPLGYWESVEVVNFNNALLSRLGRHWADPTPLDKDSKQLLAEHDIDSAMRVLEVAASGAEGSPSPLVIKDPRCSWLMPLWSQAARRLGHKPVCLLAYRHPEDVYRSLHARERMTREHAFDLWLSYVLEAELGTRGQARMLVRFDSLLSNWRGVLEEIRDKTGVLKPDGIASGEARIDAFLDTNQRHHATREDQVSAADYGNSGLINAAYGLLERTNQWVDEDAFDRVRDQWLEDWQERKPGAGGSDIVFSLPGWHAEQSALCVARKDYGEALKALARAIALAPDIARFHFLTGNVLMKLERRQEAIESYFRAIELAPRVARFHRPLLEPLRRLGRDAEALIIAERLVDLEPDAAGYNELGACLTKVDRLEEAVDAYKQALALDPNRAPAHLSLGNLMERLGKPEQAADALSGAVGCGAASAGLHDRLGQVLAGLNRWPEAVIAYDKAIEIRKQLFGLAGARESLKGQRKTKGELLGLLARLGVRYWSRSLLGLLEGNEEERRGLPVFWPFGKALPPRPRVDIPSPDNGVPNDRPLLSVMLPVYNVREASWLRTCLNGILAQDKGAAWAEIVVVDDGSETGIAEEVAMEYGERVLYVRNKRNLGLVGNHNHCISLAKGQFVHFLHQDDTIEPGFYDAVLEPLCADERLVAAFTHNRFIDGQGNYLSKTDPPRPSLGILQDWHIRLSLELRIQFPSIVVRRRSYEAVGGFLPERRFSFDWDLWNHIAASGPVWYDPRPLANYRIHEGSATYQFGWKERVVDAMQTVANMVELVPAEARGAVAEMGMYKFFLRYWGLITAEPLEGDTDGRLELAEFLLSGWAAEDERKMLLARLSEFN